jgi:hypothetical protein
LHALRLQVLLQLLLVLILPPPLPFLPLVPLLPLSPSPSALSLTIPLSMFADWMFKNESPTGYLWGGSLCVILGFVAVSVQPSGSSARSSAGGDGTEFTPVATSSPMGASPSSVTSNGGSMGYDATAYSDGPSSQRSVERKRSNSRSGSHAIAPV